MTTALGKIPANFTRASKTLLVNINCHCPNERYFHWTLETQVLVPAIPLTTLCDHRQISFLLRASVSLPTLSAKTIDSLGQGLPLGIGNVQFSTKGHGFNWIVLILIMSNGRIYNQQVASCEQHYSVLVVSTSNFPYKRGGVVLWEQGSSEPWGKAHSQMLPLDKRSQRNIVKVWFLFMSCLLDGFGGSPFFSTNTASHSMQQKNKNARVIQNSLSIMSFHLQQAPS